MISKEKKIKKLENLAKACANATDNDMKKMWFDKLIDLAKKYDMRECLFATSGVIEKKMEFSYRKSGSAALDMAYIACGRYDGFFQKNLHLWDIAAGLIIVKEAGGITNKIDLENYKDHKIIASSPDINDKLMKKISNF